MGDLCGIPLHPPAQLPAPIHPLLYDLPCWRPGCCHTRRSLSGWRARASASARSTTSCGTGCLRGSATGESHSPCCTQVSSPDEGFGCMVVLLGQAAWLLGRVPHTRCQGGHLCTCVLVMGHHLLHSFSQVLLVHCLVCMRVLLQRVVTALPCLSPRTSCPSPCQRQTTSSPAAPLRAPWQSLTAGSTPQTQRQVGQAVWAGVGWWLGAWPFS